MDVTWFLRLSIVCIDTYVAALLQRPGVVFNQEEAALHFLSLETENIEMHGLKRL